MIARFSRRVMMAVMIVIGVVMVVSVPMVVLGVIVLTIPVVAFNDLHASLCAAGSLRQLPHSR